MLCCPGLKQDRKLFQDRIRVLISEPEPEPEPEPDPHLYLGAGTGPESLVRSRNRIRVLISDPEPHSYSGAGTVHEKLTLSATIPVLVPAKKLRKFSRVGKKKKKFIPQAGFEPIITALPAQTPVHSATRLAAAGNRFLPNLYTLNP